MGIQKGSLEIIAGLLITAGVVLAAVFWSTVVRDAPPLDLITDEANTELSTTSGTGEDTAFVAYVSGIAGTIIAGPTCPVVQEPPLKGCADKPLKTLVAIYRASDPVHAIALTQSNAEGTFEASLPPGDYIVGAGESELPRCAATNVTVLPEVYASVTIECDTGIR